jgi:RNA 2',3'-cyclic 3'-phosphodiesterase
MRLFVAVEIDEAVRHALGDVVARFAEAVANVPGLQVRWVRVEQIHVTLRFLGDIADDRLPTVEAALAAVESGPPFDLRLAGIGLFPPAGRPAVVWAGLEGAAPLVALQARIESQLRQTGIAAETRRYRPHITLGRVTSARAGARAALEEGQPEVPPVSWPVDHFSLVQSHLSPRGARHEARLRVPLIR